MSFVVGLKDNFLKGKREILKRAEELYVKTNSWEEVELFLRKNFEKDLSFKSLNFFTYMFFIGGSVLIPSFFLWKFVFPDNSVTHFIFKLVFIVCAMLTLKGIVGHYVVVFLNRDKFEAELRILKATLEGGGHGKQPN